MIHQYNTPIKKLERVKAVIQAVPEEAFYMWAWKEKTDCGTIACAWGHTLMKTPEFEDDWSLTDEPLEEGSTLLYLNRMPHNVFKTLAGYIGITEADTIDIFHVKSYQSKYPTPMEVISKINNLIENLQPRGALEGSEKG